MAARALAVTHLKDVKEWVVFEEVCVENFVAVFLVDVAATANARGRIDDTAAQKFITLLIVDSLQLGVR